MIVLGSLTVAVAAVAVMQLEVEPPPAVERFPGRVDDEPRMEFRRTDQQGVLGDPIWELALIHEGSEMVLPAVSGRANAQRNHLRQVGGTRSPLPVGRYRVAYPEVILPGDPVELGRAGWVAVRPLFGTGRTALGIHHDPSFDLSNGESGTDGCIGLVRAEDMKYVVNWVKNNNPKMLYVLD